MEEAIKNIFKENNFQPAIALYQYIYSTLLDQQQEKTSAQSQIEKIIEKLKTDPELQDNEVWNYFLRRYQRKKGKGKPRYWNDFLLRLENIVRFLGSFGRPFTQKIERIQHKKQEDQQTAKKRYQALKSKHFTDLFLKTLAKKGKVTDELIQKLEVLYPIWLEEFNPKHPRSFTVLDSRILNFLRIWLNILGFKQVKNILEKWASGQVINKPDRLYSFLDPLVFLFYRGSPDGVKRLMRETLLHTLEPIQNKPNPDDDSAFKNLENEFSSNSWKGKEKKDKILQLLFQRRPQKKRMQTTLPLIHISPKKSQQQNTTEYLGNVSIQQQTPSVYRPIYSVIQKQVETPKHKSATTIWSSSVSIPSNVKNMIITARRYGAGFR